MLILFVLLLGLLICDFIANCPLNVRLLNGLFINVGFLLGVVTMIPLLSLF